MKKLTIISSVAVSTRMANAAGGGYGRLLAIIIGLALAPALAWSQAISPAFFGINYWNVKPGPNSPLTNPNTALTDDIRKADLRWMRIGGARFDDDVLWQNPASYASAISYARSLGAEPIVQVPITLTPNQLSGFVAYFDSHGITVTYWAIGNEQDPADDDKTTTHEPANWSSGSLQNKYNLTYGDWVSRYKSLASRLKNDFPDCKLVGPDFRLFYPTVMNDYYAKFLNDVGTASYLNAATNVKRPLLDYFVFHFYADKTETELNTTFGLLKTLVDNANNIRTPKGFAPLVIGVTEVNATNTNNGTTLARANNFRAGQFVALMAKQTMQQSGLCFIPWSIFESSADSSKYDYSLYQTDTGTPQRRSTMWHLAMLSNYRQANVMNGTKKRHDQQRRGISGHARPHHRLHRADNEHDGWHGHHHRHHL